MSNALNSEHRYRLWLAGIFVVALATRIVVVSHFQGLGSDPDCEANPDQCQYELLTYNLSRGEGYVLELGVPTACRTPGTSLSLLPVYLATDRSYLAGRLWWCLIGALTCPAMAWVASLCFDRRVALVSAAGFALYPASIYNSMHFGSEAPFGLALALASGITIRALQTRSAWLAAASGMLWGFGALIRPQILPALPLAWLIAFLCRSNSRWINLRLVGLMTAGLTAVLTPWILRNALVMGKPTMATILSGYGFWYGNNELALNDPELCGTCPFVYDLVDADHPLKGDEIQRESAAWRYGLEFVRTHMADMPRLCLMKVYRFLTPFEQTPNRMLYWAFAAGWLVAAPFVLAGSILVGKKSPMAASVLLTPLVAALLLTIIFYGLIRYRDAYAPTFLILGSVAIVVLYDRFHLGARHSAAIADP